MTVSVMNTHTSDYLLKETTAASEHDFVWKRKPSWGFFDPDVTVLLLFCSIDFDNLDSFLTSLMRPVFFGWLE